MGNKVVSGRDLSFAPFYLQGEFDRPRMEKNLEEVAKNPDTSSDRPPGTIQSFLSPRENLFLWDKVHSESERQKHDNQQVNSNERSKLGATNRIRTTDCVVLWLSIMRR